MFADALAVPRVSRQVPYALAFTGGFVLEMQDRLLQRSRPPRVTRYGAWLLGRYLEYSTEKARRSWAGNHRSATKRVSGEPCDGFTNKRRKGPLASSRTGQAIDSSPV